MVEGVKKKAAEAGLVMNIIDGNQAKKERSI
jgi:hypothetical protein